MWCSAMHMITKVRLVNISNTSHGYLFLKFYTEIKVLEEARKKKIPQASRLEEKTSRHAFVPAALIKPYRVYKKLPEPIHESIVVAGWKPNNKNQITSI